jgi:hypothetical protein
MIPEKATSQTAILVGTNLPWRRRRRRRIKKSSERRLRMMLCSGKTKQNKTKKPFKSIEASDR